MKPTVPWNVAWTGEEGFEVRPCRWAGGRLALWSPHRPGEGRPIYAEMHMVRQRRSIREMRCTLCGEKTTAGDRWWFRLGRIQDGHFMTEEAPLHRACADRAATSCPHLRERAQDLEPFPTDYRVLASVIAGPMAERDFGVKIGGRTVIGALKLAWPVPASARAS